MPQPSNARPSKSFGHPRGLDVHILHVAVGPPSVPSLLRASHEVLIAIPGVGRLVVLLHASAFCAPAPNENGVTH